jgi:hypothetical protein
MGVSQATVQRVGGRHHFPLAALVFGALVFAGFARTYYLKGYFGTPALPSLLVHVHGLVMTAWVLLFASQVWLIRSNNVALHMKMGVAGVVLAVLVVVVGFFTAISAAKNGSASTPPNIPRLVFLAVPMFDLVMMVILFGAAIYYRGTPANHKRLMLLAIINLLPPALGRIPIPALQASGPAFFFGFPTLVILAALIYDRRYKGVWNRAFVIGAILLIASYPIRVLVAWSPAWIAFAAWLTKFALV